MGGKGSGGLRVNAGRKGKTDAAKWLDGNAGKRGGAVKPKAAPPVVLIAAPTDLAGDALAVWNALAPHACAARTLVAGTAQAFRDLCGRIVLLRKIEAQIEADGLMDTKVSLQMDEAGGGLQSVQKKAHDLLTKCMTMMQRVDQGMLRFRLSPMGKEIIAPEPTKDEWSEFDGPSAVN